jgi:hypothetical protein
MSCMIQTAAYRRPVRTPVLHPRWWVTRSDLLRADASNFAAAKIPQTERCERRSWWIRTAVKIFRRTNVPAAKLVKY